ncbi:hypothetical protein BSL78_15707 [Apostichopus japonicus]|uniref:Protein FAM72A n=1 Tax=Stichopus japonicus TaxID=307972 RepID=A0A2G8KHE2_STIJA|nr:hypothetical protein BSL78_15707 [Apostichopus japonicus]
MGCTQCGNVVGYHVEVPCLTCLQACHNGHLWIFHSNAIETQEIEDRMGTGFLKWDQIPECSEESTLHATSAEDLTDLECFR